MRAVSTLMLNSSPSDRIPVLLDTDIGSDIDDAVALAYLLRQPRCELLGITTVSGEPEKRAALADALCRAAGRDDIPVAVGCDPPLLTPPRQVAAPQAEALTTDWPHRDFTRCCTAIEVLRGAIRSRPGEVTLLTIGPLTNIALLFAVDPEIPSMLAQLVMMGGRYDRSVEGAVYPEWNIQCDPYAAAMVFAAHVPRLTAVGLDVTMQCRRGADDCRAGFSAAGRPLELVTAMAEVFFRHEAAITFHDPLAAAVIFDPTVCTTEEVTVTVDLTPGPGFAHTRTAPPSAGHPTHRAAMSVDSERFFSEYFGVIRAR